MEVIIDGVTNLVIVNNDGVNCPPPKESFSSEKAIAAVLAASMILPEEKTRLETWDHFLHDPRNKIEKGGLYVASLNGNDDVKREVVLRRDADKVHLKVKQSPEDNTSLGLEFKGQGIDSLLGTNGRYKKLHSDILTMMEGVGHADVVSRVNKIVDWFYRQSAVSKKDQEIVRQIFTNSIHTYIACRNASGRRQGLLRRRKQVQVNDVKIGNISMSSFLENRDFVEEEQSRIIELSA